MKQILRYIGTRANKSAKFQINHPNSFPSTTTTPLIRTARQVERAREGRNGGSPFSEAATHCRGPFEGRPDPVFKLRGNRPRRAVSCASVTSYKRLPSSRRCLLLSPLSSAGRTEEANPSRISFHPRESPIDSPALDRPSTSKGERATFWECD